VGTPPAASEEGSHQWAIRTVRCGLHPKAKATLLQCVYEESEKVVFFEDMGRTAASRFDELWRKNSPVPDSFQSLRPDASEEYRKSSYYFLWGLSRASAEFFTAAARIKHEGFREEREWRVIFQAAKRVRVGALRPTWTAAGNPIKTVRKQCAKLR
jgi:hypothetical protein